MNGRQCTTEDIDDDTVEVEGVCEEKAKGGSSTGAYLPPMSAGQVRTNPRAPDLSDGIKQRRRVRMHAHSTSTSTSTTTN